MAPPDQVVFYSRIDAFGDGLLRLPALRAARTAFPRSRIVYASSGPSTLARQLGRHVDKLVDAVRPQTEMGAVLDEFAARKSSTVVIDLRNLLPRLAAARLKTLVAGIDYEANFPGFALSWPRRRLAVRPHHNAWRYHRLVERIAGRALPFDHRLTPGAAVRAEAARFVGDDRRPLVLLNAHSPFENRFLPSQVAAVATGLADRGCRVVQLVTPGEGPSAETLRAAEPRVEAISPDAAATPADLDELFLALGEHARAFFGTDGGMAHLMATVMTPIVMVNRGYSIERWRPLSERVEVVEARAESPSGRVGDVPPQSILAAVDRLFSALERDHG